MGEAPTVEPGSDLAERTCEQCGESFVPQRSTGRYCTPRCRKRAERERRAARLAAAAEEEAAADAAASVEGLVSALEIKLAEAGVTQTFEGQLALQLAGKIANPGESGVATLAKVLLTVVEAAVAGKTVTTGAAPPPTDPVEAEEDEVRRRRDLKLAGAGQATDRA